MMAPMALMPTVLAFASGHRDRFRILLANLGVLLALRFVSLLLGGVGLIALFAWSIRAKDVRR